MQVLEARTWSAMARVSILEKEKAREDWWVFQHAIVMGVRTDNGRDVVGAARQRNWRHGHQLLVSALNPDSSQPESAAFSKALRRLARTRKTLDEEETKRWFSYESFLQLLGMVSINQEDSGGVYALHSHLNHSCQPNVQVSSGTASGAHPPGAKSP